jgi:hypothetical protein
MDEVLLPDRSRRRPYIKRSGLRVDRWFCFHLWPRATDCRFLSAFDRITVQLKRNMPQSTETTVQNISSRATNSIATCNTSTSEEDETGILKDLFPQDETLIKSDQRSGTRAGSLTDGTLKLSVDQKTTRNVVTVSGKEERKVLYNKCRNCHAMWLESPRGQLTCYFPVSYLIERRSGSVQVNYGRADGQGGTAFWSDDGKWFFQDAQGNFLCEGGKLWKGSKTNLTLGCLKNE